MYLSRLIITNFKNYSDSDIRFSPRINCFVGDNGVGKTNILDAIHYLSLTKSYFTSIDSKVIKHGEDFFLVKGVFESGDESDEVYCGFQKSKRKVFKLNSKEYNRLSDHIGKYPVVMISPADNSVIVDGSEERRKFMNNVISQYDNNYLNDVMRYNRALKNRNILLKNSVGGVSADRELLAMYDEQMIPAAGGINQARKAFIEEIIPVFQEYYSFISGKREKVELRYRSQLNSKDYREILEESYHRDTVLQHTSCGIHRDDLELLMDDFPIRETGSQGQQKSYMVALKLAKFEFIYKKSGLKPVLLMDDLFDKFDAGRVEQIINLVSDERFGQIFISDTHKDRLNMILAGSSVDYRLFRIDQGVKQVIVNGKS